MQVKELAEQAKSQLVELTGLKPITITRTFKDEQGWHIGVDMLEMARIPPASDVLGDYEVVVDEDGNMLRFVRKRTRIRGEPTAWGEKE